MHPRQRLGGLVTAKKTIRLEVFCVVPGLPNSLRNDRQDLSCYFGFPFKEKIKDTTQDADGG